MRKREEKPFVVGVAGGIGVGKSTVLEVFSSELKIPTIKADELAREAVEPGTLTHEEIADSWPMAIGEGGNLDRAWLRKNVLVDPDERAELESITHAEIKKIKDERFKKVVEHGGKLAVYEALFFELNLEGSVDRLLVVDATEEKQHEQASLRDGNDSAVAEIMKFQISREERLSRASEIDADILFNGGSESELESMAKIYGAFYQEVAERVYRIRQLEDLAIEYA